MWGLCTQHFCYYYYFRFNYLFFKFTYLVSKDSLPYCCFQIFISFFLDLALFFAMLTFLSFTLNACCTISQYFSCCINPLQCNTESWFRFALSLSYVIITFECDTYLAALFLSLALICYNIFHYSRQGIRISSHFNGLQNKFFWYLWITWKVILLFPLKINTKKQINYII